MRRPADTAEIDEDQPGGALAGWRTVLRVTVALLVLGGLWLEVRSPSEPEATDRSATELFELQGMISEVDRGIVSARAQVQATAVSLDRRGRWQDDPEPGTPVSLAECRNGLRTATKMLRACDESSSRIKEFLPLEARNQDTFAGSLKMIGNLKRRCPPRIEPVIAACQEWTRSATKRPPSPAR